VQKIEFIQPCPSGRGLIGADRAHWNADWFHDFSALSQSRQGRTFPMLFQIGAHAAADQRCVWMLRLHFVWALAEQV